MPQNLDIKRSQLIKKEKWFHCKRREYTMLNCLEKTKVSVITDALNIDNIKNIDQKKE